MYCRNCGQQYATDEAVMCVKCGVQKGTGNNFCPQCGQPTPPNSVVCLNCGVSLQNYGMQPQKSKMAAGLLGIFLGGWGIHNFYLGNTTRGIIQIIVTIVTCGIGAIWGLVEGIMILTGAINTDSKGNPLKD
ncbi:MAG: NINE protein [Roseburia sp.]|nr:NINE protein [Roseburia sp.]